MQRPNHSKNQAGLVADIGGTHSRFALTHGQLIREDTIKLYENCDFSAFEDVLMHYRNQHQDCDIGQILIAVAGVVSSDGNASLTNLDWRIDQAGVANFLGASNAKIVNDLVALGYAAATLKSSTFVSLHDGQQITSGHRQGVVLGMGTGFNLCPFTTLENGAIVCLAAEYGHSSIPINVANCLQGMEIKGDWARTPEDLFSGAGLLRLHSELSGKTVATAKELVEYALYQSDPTALKTLFCFSRLAGYLCRSIAHQFLPEAGITLAGSVSRGVFSNITLREFGEAFCNDELSPMSVTHIPVRLLSDEFAALRGLALALEFNTDIIK